jgi:hypothetical protein
LLPSPPPPPKKKKIIHVKVIPQKDIIRAYTLKLFTAITFAAS